MPFLTSYSEEWPSRFERKKTFFEKSFSPIPIQLHHIGSTAISHTIQRVVDKRHLEEFSKIIVAIGGSPQCYEHIYVPLPPLLYQESAPFEIYLLYNSEGKAITSGILLFHGNVAVIYYIATLPNQRKFG